MAGGEPVGGHADRAVFAGAVGGGDCGGGEGDIKTLLEYSRLIYIKFIYSQYVKEYICQKHFFHTTHSIKIS